MIRFLLMGFALCYLFAEFLFNVTLLDALGGRLNRSDLEALEASGKLISGVGLWLTIMKLLEPKFTKHFKLESGIATVMLVISGAILSASIFAMGKFQTSVANYLTENSTAKERKAAYAIMVTMNDVIDGTIEIKGFDISKSEFTTPIGKTYLAVLPSFAISQQNAEQTFSKAGLKSLDNIKRIEANKQGQKAWEDYKEINQAIRNTYNNQYLPASKKYGESVGFSPEAKWDDYVNEMDKRHIDIYREDRDYVRHQVIDSLRKRGVNLPYSWNLDDKNAFIAQVQKVKSSIKFSDFVYKASKRKTNLEPNLSWAEFSSSDEVQGEIRAKAKGKLNGFISMDLTRAQFFAKYVNPEANKQAGEVELKLRANISDYEDGAKYEQIGKDSVKRIKVPIIALTLSCLFALINFSFFAASFIKPWLSRVLAIALLSFFTVYPMVKNNAISNSEAFDDVVKSMPNGTQNMMLWMVNVQPTLYDNFKWMNHFSKLMKGNNG